MGHIHTGQGEHDLTVSAFIVRETDGTSLLLVHRHKSLGLLLQPGGHVELDEHPWAALLREIVEETGYDLAQLRVLQPPLRMRGPVGRAVLHPQPVSVLTVDIDRDGTHRHTDLGFAFLADGEPAGCPAEGEQTELRWASADELATLADMPPNAREVAGFVIGRVRTEWEPVPIDEFAL